MYDHIDFGPQIPFLGYFFICFKFPVSGVGTGRLKNEIGHVTYFIFEPRSLVLIKTKEGFWTKATRKLQVVIATEPRTR
jgi:hypothetical protein